MSALSPEDAARLASVRSVLDNLCTGNFSKETMRFVLDRLVAAHAEIERLSQMLLAPSAGHEARCVICGDVCISLAGNPGLWPIYIGTRGWHHTKCVLSLLAELERLRAPTGDAMEAAKAVREKIATGAVFVDQTIAAAITAAEARGRQTERHKLAEAILQDETYREWVSGAAATLKYQAGVREGIEMAALVIETARALYEAHCRTHAERDAPVKFGMNYGELNALHDAIVNYDTAIRALLPAVPKGEEK